MNSRLLSEANIFCFLFSKSRRVLPFGAYASHIGFDAIQLYYYYRIYEFIIIKGDKTHTICNFFFSFFFWESTICNL